MKILIVSPFENEFTGRGNRNIMLAQELKKRGHTVIYATSNIDHAKKSVITEVCDKKIKVDERIRIDCPVYNGNTSVMRYVCHIWFAIKLFAKLRNKRFDRVYVSTIPPEVLLVVSFVDVKKRIFDVRDVWPDALMNYEGKYLVKKVFAAYCNLVYRVGLKNYSEGVLVAKGYKNWIKRYCKRINATFIPLGFRSEKVHELDAVGKEYKYKYCYAGGITPQFNIEEFYPVIKGQKNVFIGSGPNVDKLIKLFPESEFTGAISRDNAESIMRDSECLLFPSNEYAMLPNKAFDYYIMNKPILFGKNVSDDVKNIYENIIKLDNGYFYCDSDSSRSVNKFLSQKYLINELASLVEN